MNFCGQQTDTLVIIELLSCLKRRAENEIGTLSFLPWLTPSYPKSEMIRSFYFYSDICLLKNLLMKNEPKALNVYFSSDYPSMLFSFSASLFSCESNATITNGCSFDHPSVCHKSKPSIFHLSSPASQQPSSPPSPTPSLLPSSPLSPPSSSLPYSTSFIF